MTDAHDLYGLSLDRFVPERNALAKTLRAEGRRDEAERVARLRKPSVAAWTVNQLVRTQTDAVADLFDAGDELQRAQSDLLAGRGDARALRQAAERERAAVAGLAGTSRGLLSSEGHEPTDSTLERVSETLHAAALDAGARDQLRDGSLERELRWVGFGDGEAAVASPPRAPGRGRSSSPPKGTKPRAARATVEREGRQRQRVEHERAERERVERERAERHRAEQLKAARKAEADAGRRAERAARELRSAQERRDRAASVLREAEETLAAASERAEEAAVEHRRAHRALEDL